MGGILGGAYSRLTGSGAPEVGELAPEVEGRQPRQFFLHVGALVCTKVGDGLTDPKLVLSWILGSLGAPASAIGCLVPVREAGALLPQLYLGSSLRNAGRMRWFWAAGAVGQGAAVLGMGAAALASLDRLDGESAGWIVVSLLAVFAAFRSLCSVTYRALQARTLVKSTRGTAAGLAGSMGALIVFGFGASLAAGWLPKDVASIATIVAAAGALWLLAAALSLGLIEDASADRATGRRQGDGTSSTFGQLRLLREDPQLGRFTLVRALLTSTALAPPFVVTVNQSGLGALGTFVIASAAASVLSSYVWGRLADRSSRSVLILSGVVASAALLGVAGLGLASANESIMDAALPLALFVLMVAYQGVRLGRSTHLVDMAPPGYRGAYTAVSNTVIGVAILCAGAFGWAANEYGSAAVLMVFAGMSAAAAWAARGLDEVQV